MIVNELFNKPYPHSELFQIANLWASWFYSKESTYLFGAENLSAYGGDNSWNVGFTQFDFKPDVPEEDLYEMPAWKQIAGRAMFGGGKQYNTKTGDQFAVLSTVVDIMTEFVKKVKPPKMEMSTFAGESGRVKLYRRLATKAAKEWGYSVKEEVEQDIITWYLVRQQTRIQKLGKRLSGLTSPR